jgi:hypothetical protein
VTAYAVAFAVRIFFFFGMFIVTLKRQELYWDSFCYGICLVLCCNFVLYGMTQFSAVNVVATTVIIALVASLNYLVRFKRIKSHAEARKLIEEDAIKYQKAWDAVLKGSTFMTNFDLQHSLLTLWDDDAHHPVEVLGSKIHIQQDCNDLEFLYFLAEFVNGPFNDMVSKWCSGKNTNRKSDVEQFFNAGTDGSTLFKTPPIVIRGPIKSVQRSIEKVNTR